MKKFYEFEYYANNKGIVLTKQQFILIIAFMMLLNMIIIFFRPIVSNEYIVEFDEQCTGNCVGAKDGIFTLQVPSCPTHLPLQWDSYFFHHLIGNYIPCHIPPHTHVHASFISCSNHTLQYQCIHTKEYQVVFCPLGYTQVYGPIHYNTKFNCPIGFFIKNIIPLGETFKYECALPIPFKLSLNETLCPYW